MTINWSQPTPVRRSATARARIESSSDEGLRAGVQHHEVVAETVHLYEGPQVHVAGYRARKARRLAPIRAPWSSARAAREAGYFLRRRAENLA